VAVVKFKALLRSESGEDSEGYAGTLWAPIGTALENVEKALFTCRMAQ